MTELRALKREGHAEAVAIVGQRADGAPPPMPTFTTPGADDLTTFRDDLYQDDLFAASKNDFTEARYDDAIGGGGNSPYGDDRVHQLMPEILANAGNPSAPVAKREGYIGLFIFLPKTMKGEFVPLLDEVLPRVERFDGRATE